MKKLRAIIVLLLVVSTPLPVFASAASMPHCDMMESMDMDMSSMGNTIQADCCDCVDGASCNAPCAAGASFLSAELPDLLSQYDDKGEFGPLYIAVSPAPPDRLLRPPISI